MFSENHLLRGFLISNIASFMDRYLLGLHLASGLDLGRNWVTCFLKGEENVYNLEVTFPELFFCSMILFSSSASTP